MKRLLNFRLPFALALALAGGAVFSYVLFYFGAAASYYYIAIPIVAVTVLLCALLTKNGFKIFCAVSVAVMLLVGVFYSQFAFSKYTQTEVDESQVVKVCGRVEDVFNGDDCYKLTLSRIDAGGKKLSGGALITLYPGFAVKCKAGDEVTFYATLKHEDLIEFGKLNNVATDGIKYVGAVVGGFKAEHKFSLFATVRSSIYGVLNENLHSETAAVAYAMLTGNTVGMSAQTKAAFRYGGIAHIFAVSGLHIGVLYGALSLLFKKCKVNKYVSSAITLAVILFYAGVCGFTPSSVRALIMCTVASLARYIYRKYDSLNSLSIAVIILLLVNPFNLFDVGFILSVSAVLGIILLSPTLRRLFKKLPCSLGDNLAVSLSAQIGTTPALLATFGYISGAGLILNVLVLPLLSTLYVVIFTAVLLSLIIAPLAVHILPIACIALDGTVNAAVALGFENAVISGFGGTLLAVLLLPSIIIISDKINVHGLIRKIVFVSALVPFTIASIIGWFIPAGTYRISAHAAKGSGLVLIRSPQGAVLIATESNRQSDVSAFLAENCTNDLSAVVIIGGDECIASYYSLGRSDDVYISKSLIGIQSIGSGAVKYVNEFTLHGADYTFVDSFSLKVELNGVSIGICAGEYVNMDSADVLFSMCGNTTCDTPVNVYFNTPDTRVGKTDYNIYDCGDLHFSANGDKLILENIIVRRA